MPLEIERKFIVSLIFHTGSPSEKKQGFLQTPLQYEGEPDEPNPMKDFGSWPVPFIDYEVNQILLENPKPGVAERIRRRRPVGTEKEQPWVYTHTIKHPVSAGVNEEIEVEITREKYLDLLERRMDGHRQIHKTRRVFDYKGHTFELDMFHKPDGLWMLEVELESMDEEVEFPDWMEFHEVTGNPMFNNATIGRIDWGSGDRTSLTTTLASEMESRMAPLGWEFDLVESWVGECWATIQELTARGRRWGFSLVLTNGATLRLRLRDGLAGPGEDFHLSAHLAIYEPTDDGEDSHLLAYWSDYQKGRADFELADAMWAKVQEDIALGHVAHKGQKLGCNTCKGECKYTGLLQMKTA